MRPVPVLTALLLALSVAGCSKPESYVRIPTIPPVNGPTVDTTPPEKPEPAQPPLDPSSFSYVLNENGHTFVVLHTDPDEMRWPVGAPRLVSDGNPIVTKREVDYAALPRELVRQAGSHVRLYGAEGFVCEGVLGPLSMLGRVEPHFGQRAQWQGEDLDGAPAKPATAEQVAAEAWDLAEGGRSLAAEITEVRGDCSRALYARAEALPAPKSVRAARPSPALQARAIEALHTLEGYDVIHEMYETSGIAQPGVAWEDHDGASPTIDVFSGEGGTYVWLDASSGEACSSFRGHLTALFGVAPDGSLSPLYEGEEDFFPSVLLQLEPGGAPMFLGHQTILRSHPEGFAIHSLSVPFLDCPC